MTQEEEEEYFGISVDLTDAVPDRVIAGRRFERYVGEYGVKYDVTGARYQGDDRHRTLDFEVYFCPAVRFKGGDWGRDRVVSKRDDPGVEETAGAGIDPKEREWKEYKILWCVAAESGLPFIPLSDPELTAIQAYEVWQEKTLKQDEHGCGATQPQSPLDKLMQMNYNMVNSGELYFECEQNCISEGAAMQNDQVGKAIPWNPWHGCKKVSPGCKNCFVYKQDRRYGRDTTKIEKGKTTYELKDKDVPPHSVIKLCFSSDVLKRYNMSLKNVVRGYDHGSCILKFTGFGTRWFSGFKTERIKL